MEIQYLKGVGTKRAALLKSELGLESIEDLLHFYPTRYIDRSCFVRIADVVPDAAYIQIRARVVRKDQMPKRLSVWVEDDSGRMELVFFKGVKYVAAKLEPGLEFVFFGKPSVFNGVINLVHPEIDPAADDMLSGKMTGIYPSTEKLRNAGVTAKVMNKIMSSALAVGLAGVKENLPDYVLKGKQLVPIHFALRNIHFPDSADALVKAQRRLKFEELFLLQLSLLKAKYIRMRGSNGIVMDKVGADFNACYNALPYSLTGAQKRVIKEIREDFRSGRQMNRLLQGDVGSGKTMVAVLSALMAYGYGYQSCIMAPTEVLAQQHYRNICKYLAPTGVRCALLTGSTKTAERREIHAGLEDGSIGIIVGTHALIEENVVFHNLGYAVIDEQHRFGVDQRARLWSKRSDGFLPHVLVMTATPIPRTLAMTLYGDLDVSVLDEMPPGRTPIITKHCYEDKRNAVFKFMKEQIALGRQIFVVYPLIFESEKMDYKNLEVGFEQIATAFRLEDGYKVAIVHGQQSIQDKDFNMQAFVAGRANIMVATSVIEVGVDVPNATVMVIESAERFGLAQLHQLRGRVGRGSNQSYCLLMTDYKLSKESKRRIELMCATDNGFELAEEDMKLRGPGDLEGTAQSGMPIELNIASLAKDGLILSDARDYAARILERDPMLSNPLNAPLVEALKSGKYNLKDYSVIS
ncbi:MAG: ATP-dependent DNA helicase RecG [Bacteroidales bacterium]|nr:ATP-dependent DNA helicase RecG [Bacteroidales bacterium]